MTAYHFHSTSFLSAQIDDWELAKMCALLDLAPDSHALPSGRQCQVRFRYPVDKQLLPEARLCKLLDEMLSQADMLPENEPVLICLPAYLGISPEAMQQFAEQLPQYYRWMQHPETRSFDYGRSSAPIAFQYATQLLEKGNENVWILAMDTLASESLLTLYDQQKRLQVAMSWDEDEPDEDAEMALSEGGMIPSEAVMLTAVSKVDKGLSLLYAGVDAHISAANSAGDRLGHLLKQACLQLDNLPKRQGVQSDNPMIHQIILPDSGDPGANGNSINSIWSSAYYSLAGKVDQHTSMRFPGYETGEMGTVGGLYRLLIAVDELKQKTNPHYLVQIEVSDSLYRSVGLYGNSD